jgi:RNA polymerase subunit RPABC4/transcription elongation factor Spt4
MKAECTTCGGELTTGGETCSQCGAPTGSRVAAGEQAACHACGAVLWSMSPTCPKCRAEGYPALRPDWGDRSAGRPADK